MAPQRTGALAQKCATTLSYGAALYTVHTSCQTFHLRLRCELAGVGLQVNALRSQKSSSNDVFDALRAFCIIGIFDALGLAITGSTWLTWVMWLYRAFWMLGVRLGCVSLPRHHLIQASHCDNLSNRKETQTHLYSVLAFAGPSSRPVSPVC